MLRGIYFLIDFCYYLSGLAYHSVKASWSLTLTTFSEGLYTDVEISPFKDYLIVFADAAHGYLLYYNNLPFHLLLFQGLFDFEALLAMGVLSFFTVENLL